MKVFKKNFEIQRTALHMATPAIFDMIKYHHEITGKKIINEFIWIQEDYNNIATYVPTKELRKLITTTINVIHRNPILIHEIHKKTILDSNNYINYGKKILRMNLSKLNNSQLAEIFLRHDYLNKIHHGPAIATTWFLDSDNEDFSKLLYKKTEDLIKLCGINLSTAEVFSALTTPEKISFEVKEEIESLKVVKAIKKNHQANKLFKTKNVKEIENSLNQIDQSLRKIMQRHVNKWNWLPYTYIGPSYELDYYLTAWSGIIKENIDAKQFIKKLQNQGQEAKKRKLFLIKNLKINKNDLSVFNIASEIIYLKAYRKSAMFFGCYVLEKMHKEIAKRLNLTLKQVRFMGWWEIEPALKNNYFSSEILNSRIKFCVFYQKGDKNVIYSNGKAKNFLKKQKFEKEIIKKTNILTGTPASPGYSKAVVKIINIPEEIKKIKKGEIMIAHTTFPALIPAMRLASAIVTDDGGITCHAAIVARELKKPCVVGTKIATKVFKDEDVLEVDANKGIVKKIK